MSVVNEQQVDVLLVVPNYYSNVLITDAVVYPINLAYLAAYIRDRGVKVGIIDGRAMDYALEDYKEIISRLRPKVVGITVMTSYVNQAIGIAALAKSISREITVIVGGAHISALPVETLESCSSIDIAVVGEGERTLFELSERLLNGNSDVSDVDGIYYREDGKVKSTGTRELIQDLDSLPFPAYDLLPLDRYRPSIQWIKKRPFLMVYTARGCPFNCKFCASRVNFGGSVRYRSPANVLEEIEYYKERYGIKEVIFYDETFVINKKHVEALCDLMIERNVDLVWGCFSAISTMNVSLANKMKEAGCFTIFFGLESGSEEILESLNKSYTSIDLARKVVSDVRSAGITPVGSFLLGVPGETEATIEETIKFALELPLSYATFNPVVPFPGSVLFEEAKKKGVLPEIITDWSNFEINREPFLLSDVSRDKLLYYASLAYRKFYFRPRIALSVIGDSLSFYKLWHNLRTSVRIVKLIVSNFLGLRKN